MVRQRWPYATKLTISLLLLAFFIYLFTRFREIIPPIIIAIIIAYILNPIVNFIQKQGAAAKSANNYIYLYPFYCDHHNNSHLDHPKDGREY